MPINLFRHPLAMQIDDLNDIATYSVHRQIILSKPFLAKIYRRFYSDLLESFDRKQLHKLQIVEIGAGGFNANEFHPEIITTDLTENQYIKQQADAQNLCFDDQTLDGIILLDVLHHIPDPTLFFQETRRCLKKGGRLVMIEPYYSPWSSLVYKNLHHEPWSDDPDWKIQKSSGGRLSEANMKMPHNIFIRDRKLFEETFPELKILSIRKINFFSYLLSGGLSYRCPVPSWLAGPIFLIEKFLSPLSSIFAMHMVVTIEKQ